MMECNNLSFDEVALCHGPYRHSHTIDGVRGSAYKIMLSDGSKPEGIIMNYDKDYYSSFPREVGYIKTNKKNPYDGTPLYKLYLY